MFGGKGIMSLSRYIHSTIGMGSRCRESFLLGREMFSSAAPSISFSSSSSSKRDTLEKAKIKEMIEKFKARPHIKVCICNAIAF